MTQIGYKELFEYFITVNNETTSLDLSYIKEDNEAIVTITGNESFEVGMNEVRITVTRVVSEELTLENTYIIYVNRNMSTNNYLATLYLSNGSLSPDFNKETLTYMVNVDSTVDSVVVYGTTEDATAKITSGLGTHSLDFGKNIINVKVRSAIGITRNYTIEITKLASSNNKLNNLIVKDISSNIIDSTDAFNPDNNSYTYNLDKSLDYININAYKGDEYQTISGDGTKELQPGVNTFDIIVTAGNGDINTYTLIINNPLDSNNFASMITPSSGTLSPIFDKETTGYTLDLGNDVNTLEFTVTLESSKATVTGHELKGVPEGISTREIIVKAEDGTEKKYTITINKEQASNALLDSLTVEDYPFEFDSNTFDYTLKVSGSKRKLLVSEIEAIAKDTEATVNLMGDLELKEGIVNIYVIEVIARDGFTTQEYRLNITRDSEEYTIRSEVYSIVRDDTDEDYVMKIEPNQELETFMGNFQNDRETLKFYDKDDNEVTSIKAVGTGSKVKLVIDNTVYDEVRVIVAGDTNGDGKVNVSDSMQVNNTVLKKISLSGYQFKAGDINHDGKINVSDSMLVNNYVLKKIATLII